jgi:ATP-dependent DNA ligase
MNRPLYKETSLADALAFNWRGWNLSEKMDGVWTVSVFGGSLVTGEIMPDGRFYGFDIACIAGEDVRCRSWFERSEALIDCAAHYGFPLVKQGSGTEFIEAILHDGGEGVVAKPFDAPFGRDWFKVKRVETFDVTVTAKLRGAIAIAYEGQNAGKCPLAGRKLELVRIGDVVEIAAYKRYASGKFREPRFIRFRKDKKIDFENNLSGESLSLTIALP